jgi:putative flavoprotein involved in K+ transport
MYHTIVIGAGQAGLSIGYYLQQNNNDFLILEQGKRVGDIWRNRYDSLTLFTSRMYSSLPGLPLEGDIYGFPSKDEVAFYLEKYVAKFKLPIQLETEVLKITHTNEIFLVDTNKGSLTAKNIVVATGPFQQKYIPEFAQKLSKDVIQLHSSEYKNSSQLIEGNVLIVGGGNSGAQIAVELSTTKNTFLSVSQNLRFFPLMIGGKSIFWWFDKLGVLKATSTSVIGKKIQQSGDPIFGFELKKAIKEWEVTLKERVVDIKNDHVFFQNNNSLQVDNIIWATGFKTDYSWIHIENLVSKNGKIRHQRGLTAIRGLYFLGLPWQHKRGSSLLQGVGEDAKYIMEHIKERGI